MARIEDSLWFLGGEVNCRRTLGALDFEDDEVGESLSLLVWGIYGGPVSWNVDGESCWISSSFRVYLPPSLKRVTLGGDNGCCGFKGGGDSAAGVCPSGGCADCCGLLARFPSSIGGANFS
jgi:hypothetical protein